MGGDGRGGVNGWGVLGAIAWGLLGLHAVTAATTPDGGDTFVAVAAVAHVVLGLALFTRRARELAIIILVPEAVVATWLLVTTPGATALVIARLACIAGIVACHRANEHVAMKGTPAAWKPVLLAGEAVGLAVLVTVLVAPWPGAAAALAFAWTGAVAIPATVAVLHVAFVVLVKERVFVYHPLLTHHLIEEADHAIPATFGKLTVFTCTRCTGMFAGVALSAYTLFVLAIRIPPVVAFVMDIFVPMPIFFDWGTQRLGYRTSSTASRVMTGALTGFGFYLLTFTAPDYTLPAGLVLLAYFVIFFLIYYVSGRRGYPGDGDPGDLAVARDTF